MKIALLSDIHANFCALFSVLQDAKVEKVEHIICCGDFIGYYHRPAETLALLKSWPITACQGNHDVTWKEPVKVISKYGSGAQIAANELSHKQKKWLMNLNAFCDAKFDGKKILVCHGSPWNRDTYIYPDADTDVLERVASYDYDLVLMGHTHHPFRKICGSTTIVNPGSVGQQRNGAPGAHWTLWNTTTGKISARISNYDITETARLAKLIDPHLPYLVDVLSRKSAA